jgi:transcriptional regulator with XRE-family HTH domain
MAKGLESFGDRLRRILIERNMSQSDLARLVFNETRIDNRGYEVVVGKDRISAYINNRAKPEPKTLRLIANALKMTPEELAPEVVSESGKNADGPTMLVEALSGHTDKVRLQIHQLIPLHKAVKIMSIINEPDEK